MGLYKRELELYLQQHPKKHIIFDFDETIFWIHPDRAEYKRLMWQAMEEIDQALARDLKAEGKTRARDVVDAFTRIYGQQARDRVLEVTSTIEKNFQRPTEKHHDLIDFIKSNADTYTFHIRSSNLTQTFQPIVKDILGAETMTTLVGKDTVELVKQYPDGFYHIQSLHGGEKKDYLMVGNDQERDGQGAARAGIDFFWIDSSRVDRIPL